MIRYKLMIIYNMAMFNEEHKKVFNKNQFPIDLEEAYKIGTDLSSK